MKTDSRGIEWRLSDTVIKTGSGDPTTGRILSLGISGSDMVIVAIDGKDVEWVDTKDLVKYDDRSGD